MRIETNGFFDLQVNGFAGIDFNDPTNTPLSIEHASRALRATGVTRYLATLITSPLERFAKCARLLSTIEDPAIAGIHMEGPYISPEDGARGAHAREYVTSASIEDFKRRQDAASGRIVLVTLAPEAPGAVGLISYLVAHDVRAAIGHTAASSAQIRAAIDSGASLSTHLGNGCAQLLPRHPNLIWDQLAADELWMSLIVDGHHLPAETVKVMLRAKGTSRTILVTDAIAAAGCPPGNFRLGDSEVELSESGRVSVRGASNLAGSSLAMNVAVGNAVRFAGLGLEDVLPMASTIPSAYLRMTPQGTLICDWDENSCRLTIEAVQECR